MSYDASQIHQLEFLEQIEANPDLTQVDMGREVGVAIGTVKWHIKCLLRREYVKATRVRGWRVRYLITPKGNAQKSQLTVHYLQSSMHLYRACGKVWRNMPLLRRWACPHLPGRQCPPMGWT